MVSKIRLCCDLFPATRYLFPVSLVRVGKDENAQMGWLAVDC